MIKIIIEKNGILFLSFLLLFILFVGGLSWADTNGVWIFAKDIRGGTFGSDEQVPGMNFSFINPLYLYKTVYLRDNLVSLINPSTYFLNLSGRTQLNDLATNSFSTNSLTLSTIKSCSGKLYTDSTGKVVCGTDNVNDADSDPTNELQNLNSVLTRGNDAGSHRIVNVADPVNNQDVATKYYVDINKGITTETDPQVGATTYGKWCRGTGSQVTCDQNPPTSSVPSGTLAKPSKWTRSGYSWSSYATCPSGYSLNEVCIQWDNYGYCTEYLELCVKS